MVMGKCDRGDRAMVIVIAVRAQCSEVVCMMSPV